MISFKTAHDLVSETIKSLAAPKAILIKDDTLESKDLRDKLKSITPLEFLSQELRKTIIVPEQQAEIIRFFSAYDKESAPNYGDDPSIIAIAKTYAKIFDPNEYKKLLIYCKAAYIFEQNGTPEDHALRLSITFGSAKMALKYITLYKTSTKELKDGEIIDHSDDQFVHDACLFTLPDIDINWQYWRRIISPDNFVQKNIRNLFASARDIEDFIISLKKPILEVGEKEKIEKELATQINEYNKLKKHRGLLNRTDKEKCDLLATKIISLHIALSNAYGGVKLEDTPLKALISHYEQYKTEASESYKFFLSNGLSKQHYLKFLELDRTNAGANIPDIGVLTLAEHPQYLMRKLNVQNESDAAVAACLGKLTSCCQSLSGEAGESCTIHGLTSPNGGFYVIINLLTKRVVAQSWVWRGTKGELVLDSIEKSSIDDKTLKALYTAATRLIAENFAVESILVGTRGQTPRGIGCDINLSACPTDYSGYRDSHKQNAFTHALAPYLLLDYAQSSTIQDRATQMLVDALTNLEDQNNIKFITILLQILTSPPYDTIDLAIRKLSNYFNLKNLATGIYTKLKDKLTATRLLVNAISSRPANLEEARKQISSGASLDLRWVCMYVHDSHIILQQLYAMIIKSSLPHLIETPTDFYNILNYLNPEHISTLYTILKDKMIGQIKTLQDLNRICEHLNDQNKAEIISIYVDNIGDLIKSYLDLYYIFKIFTQRDLTRNLDKIKPIVLNVIRNAEEFHNIIKNLTKEQEAKLIFDLIGEEFLLSLISNFQDLEKIIKFLSLEQCRLLFEKLRPKLNSIVLDAGDFGILARDHISDYSKSIGELFGLDFIASIVKCPEDLYKISVEAKLTEEERQNLYDIIRPRLISIIKNTNDLYYAFLVFNQDQHTTIFQESIPNLSNMSATDFGFVGIDNLATVFHNLTAAQQAVLFEIVKDKLIAKLKEEVNIEEITKILNELNNEQYRIIIEDLRLSIRAKTYRIENIIWNIKKFASEPRKIKIFFDLIAEHILAFITTKKDFANLLNEIVNVTDNQDNFSFLLNHFMLIARDKLLGLITSINDFEDLIKFLQTTRYKEKSNLKIKAIFELSYEKLLTLVISQQDLITILNLADQANLPIDELTSVCRALYLVASKTSTKLDDVQIFLAKLLSLNALKSTGLPYVTTIFLPRILAVEKTTIDSRSQTTEDSEPEGTVKTVVSPLRETKADRTKGESSGALPVLNRTFAV